MYRNSVPYVRLVTSRGTICGDEGREPAGFSPLSLFPSIIVEIKRVTPAFMRAIELNPSWHAVSITHANFTLT